MYFIGISLLLFAAIISSVSLTAVETTSKRICLVVAFVAAAFGTYLSQLPPHIALIGVLLFALSFLRFFDDRTSKELRRFGGLVFISAIVVLVVGLFASPTNKETEIEDRTDWTPPVVIDMSPQELLTLDWSTKDKNCHWPVAKLMLELCDIAYDPPVDAKERIEKLGFESESINAGAMQGYVLDAGDDSIIILRGTERHEYDILQDLRFLKGKVGQGSMHGGFVNGYLPMHSQVSKILTKYETKRVWITGHSLGGGLAIVCAHQLLVDEQYPIAGVMTFGQPKAISDDLRSYLEPRLDGKYVFFVNDMDPVTRVVDPYTHFGHMVRWTDSNIERSKRQVAFGSVGKALSAPGAELESGYIEPMSNTEFDELIDKIEDSKKPKYDENGNLVVEGYVPNVFDHFLSAYDFMLEQLRTHKTTQ